MKTNSQNQKSGTPNRNEQSSSTNAGNRVETPEAGKSIKPYVNYAERDANRNLPVEKVLEKLRRWNPAQFELAEVVGQWVWITFPEPPIERVRAELSQLGFHWNNARKCWQHPCGNFVEKRGTQDPRQKYGSQPATVQA